MPITDSEKAHRRALFKTHYDLENDHDMKGIMATPTRSKRCRFQQSKRIFTKLKEER